MNTNSDSEDNSLKGIPVITFTNDVTTNDEMLEALIGSLEGPRFMHRTRPYSGQAHTDTGIRGSQEVIGLTMRDIRDCFVRAFILSHPYYIDGTLNRFEPNATLCDEANKGEKAQLNGNDLYKLKGDIDPIAVAQNLTCEIEKMMSIFPNVPELRYKKDSEE